MPEFRKDPIVDRWIIVSTERSQRPSDVQLRAGIPRPDGCPFCSGREAMTPPEVLAYRPCQSAPDTPGWTVRVVPNKYPAVRMEAALGGGVEGLFEMRPGIGTHEVIIETPEHDASLATLPICHVEDVFRAFRDRLLDLHRDTRLRAGLIFKNHGAAAGATLAHPHSQLIALPMVPKHLREELGGCARYYDAQGRCIFCDMIQQEVRLGCRVVYENAAFIALTPFASRFPYEVWVLPKGHEPAFERACGETFSHLAATVQAVLRRAVDLLSDPPYNMVWHSAPWGDDCGPYYHWHVEIMPRLTGVAGFEWGTGFYINPMPPEEAARALRQGSNQRRD
jgi:UDPglucose--hexose-1-phosphate uridylyltransferase